MTIVSFKRKKIYQLILFFFVTSLPAREHITVSMASMPQREAMLKKTVESILPQTDTLNVFLNDYKYVPSFLKHKKIVVARSQDFEDFGSNAKFFWAEHIKGYHFTIDDDIIYPPDYIAYLIKAIESYHRKVVVGIHGVIVNHKVTNYYQDKRTIHFAASLKKSRYVTVLGNGTIGYHTQTLSLKLSDFLTRNMDDLWLAIQAKKQGVPLVCLTRKRKYLISQYDSPDSIYKSMYAACPVQTELVNTYLV